MPRRPRLPSSEIDEAHLLDNQQLEAIRMLTFDRVPGYAERTTRGQRLP
jgi:hypothetical protein